MKKRNVVAGAVCTTFLLSACQSAEDVNDSPSDSTNEASSSPTENEEMESGGEMNGADKNEHEEEDTETEKEKTDDEPDYEEQVVEGSILIEANFHDLDPRAAQSVGMSIRRMEEAFTYEESIKQALIESDYSDNASMAEAEITVEGSMLTIQFDYPDHKPEVDEYSEDNYLYKLFHLVDLYGIEEVRFQNAGGSDVILHTKNITEPGPYVIEEEIEKSKGFLTSYDEDMEETVFISMGMEDNRSFEESIEGMQEDRNFHMVSPFHEGIDLLEATFEEEIAVVSYMINRDEVTEEEQIVFERAIQLTALDYQAQELYLINETDQIKSIYPLFSEW